MAFGPRTVPDSTMSRVLASLLVFTTVFIGLSTPAAACSCDSTFGEFVQRVGSGQTNFEPALIFSGTAAGASEPDDYGNIDVIFDVEMAWTDQLVPQQVTIEVDSSSCGIGVPEGLTYFMASETTSGSLSSGTCTTSSAFGLTALFDRTFGPGQTPPRIESALLNETDDGTSLPWILLTMPVLMGVAAILVRTRQRKANEA